MGVDSMAMLVELSRRYRAGVKACRPDAILFADVGKSEKPATDRYWEVAQAFLRGVGFPEFQVVRYQPVHVKYDNLYDNCIINKTLPSLAFGYKKCSLKFKVQPQNKWTKSWPPARRIWGVGDTVIKAIGYDAGPKDMRRCKILDDKEYHYWYPLRELGWERARCLAEIRKEGLPGWTGEDYSEWVETGGVPVKSACYYCPSMKPHEVVRLCEAHPELGEKIVRMEDNARENNTTIEGLWRRATKARPGSMATFIRQNSLLTGDGST